MRGRITGISGPTIRTDLTGLKLYDRILVGRQGLTGEVVRLEPDGAVVQVYENTRGLRINEAVESLEAPLFVTLGPGLLSVMFDGLQRPLDSMYQKSGPFIEPAGEQSPIDLERRRLFTPAKQQGDTAAPGEMVGHFQEGEFLHPVMVPPHLSGTIAFVADGEIGLDEPLCRLEDGSEIKGHHLWPVRIPRPCKNKKAPHRPLITGQRIIDFLFPIARGGTAIIPGGFGAGKTILEQAIAKYADVDIVIYAGCGERGNEMAGLIEEFKAMTTPDGGQPLMGRTVLVVNTSNMPVAAREASIYTAVTIGEYYRDMGYDVLLLADSISRWAEALREISSSLEEMPGEEGYPTYLASRLFSFVERAGVVETLSGKNGSLSMILSVSPPGEDFTEPVTQALLRTTGAFLMLDSKLANARHFPAINWSQSYSLYEKALSAHYQLQLTTRWETMRCYCKELLQEEESLKEIVEIVGLEGLQERDRLVMQAAAEVRSDFLFQNVYSEDAFSDPPQTLERISGIIEAHNRAESELQNDRPEDAEGAAKANQGQIKAEDRDSGGA